MTSLILAAMLSIPPKHPKLIPPPAHHSWVKKAALKVGSTLNNIVYDSITN